MKKMIALLLALVMVFGLVACASDAPAQEEEKPAAEEEKEVVEEEEQAMAPEVDAEQAPEEIVKTDEVSSDARAAELGIPAAVKLQDTDVLQGKKIGCNIVYKGDEWCAGVASALEALGKYYGADLICEDGDINDETETKQIENMIANGCDIILHDPATPDGTTVALNKAVDAGIPVIIYDSYWSEGPEKAITTVTWDQVTTGRMIGEYLVDYVKANMDGKCRIVELSNVVSTHCQDRFVGLHQVIDAANADGCDIEIVNMFDSQGNREIAYNAVAAIVEPYDFIVSDVDNGAQGAVAALQSMGNTDVKVLSMGAYGEEPFSMLYNNDPNYLACLNVDAWILAQFVIDGAIAHFAGEELPVQTNIALFVVDNSNVTDFWTFE